MVLVITLGWGLARVGFLSTPALGELNRLTYWVGLPSLLVVRIGGAEPAFDAVGGMLAVLITTTVIILALGIVVGWVWRMPARSWVTFLHGSFRGNLTFVGLPVVIYAFAGSPQASAVESAALIAFVPMVIVYNVIAVTLMQLPGQSRPLAALKRVLLGLGTNPILLATLLGMAIALLELPLPVFLDRTLSAIGQMALPLALIGIGGGLYATRVRGKRHWAAASAAIKTGFGPLVGLAVGSWLGLGSEEMRLVLIFLACPSAAAAYVLVQQMDGDTALIASTIVLSHLFALPAMVVVLALTA